MPNRRPAVHTPAEPRLGAIRSVLDGLIDYAGLFPPAGLGMAETVRNYAGYQRRPDSWALGRLVVPVTRLAEFEDALEGLPEAERLGTRWPITALLGTDADAEIEAVTAFNSRHEHAGPRVHALEARADSPRQVSALGTAVSSRFELFLELPLGHDLPELVTAAGKLGVRAKIRTGGVNAADIPEPEAVLAFLERTATARVPFKATAGLHHPVRGLMPLTCEPGSACATMYGYLNLILAATALWDGQGRDSALTLLTAVDRHTLVLGETEIGWAGERISRDAIEQARREFVLAIGSCSFTEPLEEIDSP